MDRLRNVMGLLLGTNAHMGHKYLHKHTMHTLTFGHTRTGTHTQSQKIKANTAVAAEYNLRYQKRAS